MKDRLIKEGKYIGISFIVLLAILKIAFFREDFLTLIKTTLAIYWLFIIPGYFLLLYWSSKIGFVERFFIGIAISTAITGTISYMLGIAGINVNTHHLFLPIILIVGGFIPYYLKEKKTKT